MHNKNIRKTKSQHQSLHSENLNQQIKGLEQEIQLTIYNYENILQAEKKNSSQRADFLLYLIQSLRIRQNQQIDSLTIQLHNAQGQRQQAQNMQKQMHNIGQGLDQIVQQSRRLKSLNQSLQKQLQEQQQRDKQLDQQILICQKQVDQCRLKVDQWQRSKIKWNRHKKQILQLIQDAQQVAKQQGRQLQDSQIQKNAIEQLYNKYHNFDA